MNISELANSVIAFYDSIMKQKCRVLSVMPDNGGWTVVCEVVVDPNYTVKKGIGDIVELYEVHLNEKAEITGFELKETKRKASVDNE